MYFDDSVHYGYIPIINVEHHNLANSDGLMPHIQK